MEREATLLPAPHAKRIDVTRSSWGSALRTDPRVRRAQIQVAWELFDDPAFFLVGCRETDAAMASRLRISHFGVRNALIALRDLGYLTWTWEPADEGRVRTIRPGGCPDVAEQHPRQRRGGLPRGVSGRRRAMDKAVLASAFAAPQDGTDPQFQPPACSKAPEKARIDIATAPELESPAVEADGEFDTEREYEASASAMQHHRSTARPRRRAPDLSLWEQPRTIQVARAKSHAERLSWNAACRHDECGSRAIAVICAEEGRPFCREHEGYAAVPVDLARFGLGTEASLHRSGDFRHLPAA